MIKFVVDGQVVAQTRSRVQRTVVRIAERLANEFPGREVQIDYPEDA